jgi:hypothetical protein
VARRSAREFWTTYPPGTRNAVVRINAPRGRRCCAGGRAIVCIPFVRDQATAACRPSRQSVRRFTWHGDLVFGCAELRGSRADHPRCAARPWRTGRAHTAAVDAQDVEATPAGRYRCSTQTRSAAAATISECALSRWRHARTIALLSVRRGSRGRCRSGWPTLYGSGCPFARQPTCGRRVIRCVTNHANRQSGRHRALPTKGRRPAAVPAP